MNQTNEFFNNSELAQASYATLNKGEPDPKALIEIGMTTTQAQAFADNWTVIDQYNHSESVEILDELGNPTGFYREVSNGLSATVFEEIDTGKRYLAIRGTTLTDPADIAADGGILFHGLPDLSAQYQALKTKVEQWQHGVLQDSFTVTGHSLGGWLAGGLTVDFAVSIEHAYLYNAPGVFGVGGQLIDLFNQVFGTSFLSIDLGMISNIRAKAGISPIAGLAESLAPVVGIEIEGTVFDNHSIKHLTDALAVYNLFATVDPSTSEEAAKRTIGNGYQGSLAA